MSKGSEPAYPGASVASHGLTKRELFAAMAMAQMAGALAGIPSSAGGLIIHNQPQDVAELACLYADTLIQELSK